MEMGDHPIHSIEGYKPVGNQIFSKLLTLVLYG